LSLVLAAVLSAPLVGLGAERASAAGVIMFAEDFDGSWPPDFYVLEPVPGSWRVADNNPASGMDYWGRSSLRSYSGDNSAWCAQNGVNSVDLRLNSVNEYYDQDMQSCMMVYLGNIQGYGSAALGFYYWAVTGMEIANDYLEVRVYDGESWNRVWLQPDAASTWTSVGLEIPTTSTWIGFFFMSDALVGSGPYEGVYVDNIIVVGDDVDRPSSSAGPVAEYWVGETVYVPYSANDSFGSGINHVELYYRVAGAETFEKYVTPDNPDGEWTSAMIPFNTSLVAGDARYEFYTIAADIAGNVELGPGSPDAHITVDNSPPETTLAASDEGMRVWYTSKVNLALWAYDDLSGVSDTWFRIGAEGTWQPYEAGVTVASEGVSELQYYSEDRAGNREQVRFAYFAIDSVAPELVVIAPSNGEELTSDEVLVSWSCSDEVSGIHHVIVTVDDRRSEYCNSTMMEVLIKGLGSGYQEISVTAYDCAGNSVQQVLEVFVPEVDDEDGGGPTWKLDALALAALIAAILAIMAVILLAVSVARERRDRTLKPPGQPPSAGPPATSSAVESAPARHGVEPGGKDKPPDSPRGSASQSPGADPHPTGREGGPEASEGRSTQPEPMRTEAQSAPSSEKPPKRLKRSK